jgi:hypothetical protein
MPICPDCHRSYKHAHSICKAGTCSICNVSVQNLGAHRCPIKKVLSLNLVETWVRLHDDMTHHISCRACGIRNFLRTNIHGFRRFLGVDLCWNCYTIPQITEHIQNTRHQLLELDAQAGKWMCALCDICLFDPVTLRPLQAFERDHIDVFAKTSTVWELLVTGAPFTQITNENDKCRNLCVRCHSAVTCAERAVGILNLKAVNRGPLGVTSYTKKRALYQVETLTRMLLEDKVLQLRAQSD